ncbi:hypothetical protein SODALDRAFT_340963 [Sodiomyces alkalinus F11]|uniref:Rhodopsin domain-containing protein n=1 Tax=Sodiomyces alkalinus (strain CBS 110278 / VKM F-3762 / F11) TaxID=1314773 RepID=A0A3N2PQI0_SODAK|nr:hypothetical protein SODALDRAFT_340963 [Sodiomyces alkalinus F11]ROT36767.1 hypothetical protein SODALDRAFT_340963 [Sodiomyces alkalinus F11]
MKVRRANASGDGPALDVIDRSRDDESRFAEICAILVVGAALSTLAVTLRSITRLFLVRRFGLDDGIMVVAQVLAIGTAVAIGIESKYGLGSHTWVQPDEHFVPYMKAFYSSIVVYNVSMCLVKISILLQYRRIFPVGMIQTITFYGIAFLVAWAVTLCFLLPMVCMPVEKFWDATIPGRCLDSLAIWYVMASINVATDFIIFAMPLPVIRSLQLPRRQKLMLVGVFGLGLLTCIISIIRIRTLKVAASTDDPNWDNVDAATWSFLEVSIAVIAACLPTLRPLFSTLMPRAFAGSSARRTHHPHPRSGYGFGAYVHAGSRLPNSSGSGGGGGGGTRLGKSALGRSDSTRSLQDRDSIELAASEMKMPSLVPPGGEYSISVSAGRKGDRGVGSRVVGDESPASSVVDGIQTTTVVTQHVSPFEPERH